MSQQNPLVSNKVHSLSDNGIADTVVNFGQSSEQNSGTGIYGDASTIHICVGGTDKVTIDSSGLHGTVVGTITRADNLSGGLGGSIPYQSAVNTTAMLPNGTAGQVLASQGTTLAPNYITLPSILTFTSSAGTGGAATEVMTLTGILSTDTILSVSQKTPGANSLPLIGYSTLINDHLTAIYSADPGAGSVIVVTVKR